MNACPIFNCAVAIAGAFDLHDVKEFNRQAGILARKAQISKLLCLPDS
jgi:hypothetical protein